jgi:hypothetical protein
MRIGALLLVGVGVLMAGACTTANPPDEACVTQQGICLLTTDMVGCPNIIGEGLCADKYTCCGSPTYAGNIVDGAVIKDAYIPQLFDAGDAGDATVDGSQDAANKSDASDATIASDSGTKDSGRSDAKDTGAPKDSASPPPDAAKSKDSGADAAHDAPEAG